MDEKREYDDLVIEFMLKETETIRELLNRVTAIGEQRVNLLITLSSAAGGALLLLGQSQIDITSYYSIAWIVVASVVAMATLRFPQMIRREIRVAEYLRGLNRIRRFFTEQDQRISRYLTLPLHDDVPRIYRGYASHGLLGVVVFINSLAMGTLAFISLSLIRRTYDASFWSVGVGILVFLISYLLHNWIASRTLRQAETLYEVVFPSDSRASQANIPSGE
jgi:hypothetical protein